MLVCTSICSVTDEKGEILEEREGAFSNRWHSPFIVTALTSLTALVSLRTSFVNGAPSGINACKLPEDLIRRDNYACTCKFLD
jgi:hypothetical protein